MIRKKILVVSVFFAMIFAIAGCGKKMSGTGKNEVELYCIDITIASPNASQIHSAKYPFYYYRVDSETHKCNLIDMKKNLSKVISREDFDVFADFINEQENKSEEHNTFAYSIYISYYDEDGETKRISYYGYDVFPEELNLVIDKFNELCGEAVLTYPEELIKSEVDFIYDEFGVSESDYSRNEVEAMLEASDVKIKDLISSSKDIESYMDGYYHSMEEAKIEHLRPEKELPGEEVSEEEYKDFVDRFLDALGDDWQIYNNSRNADLTELRSETYGHMYIGRAIDLKKYKPDFEDGTIELDAGEEGMIYDADFIYDGSGNYFLADFEGCESFVEIAEIFAGLEK